MKNLECKALERFGTEVSFYFKCVDDIATAISNHLIEEFLEVLYLTLFIQSCSSLWRLVVTG